MTSTLPLGISPAQMASNAACSPSYTAHAHTACMHDAFCESRERVRDAASGGVGWGGVGWGGVGRRDGEETAESEEGKRNGEKERGSEGASTTRAPLEELECLAAQLQHSRFRRE